MFLTMKILSIIGVIIVVISLLIFLLLLWFALASWIAGKPALGEMLISIDLLKAIKPQLTKAEKILNRQAELFREMKGIAKGNSRKRSSKYTTYLRVLDATLSGADKKEIIARIYPDKDNQYPDFQGDNSLRDDKKAALKLRDGAQIESWFDQVGLSPNSSRLWQKIKSQPWSKTRKSGLMSLHGKHLKQLEQDCSDLIQSDTISDCSGAILPKDIYNDVKRKYIKHIADQVNLSLPSLKWCRRRDSNPQPFDYKSTALPIVLLRLM